MVEYLDKVVFNFITVTGHQVDVSYISTGELNKGRAEYRVYVSFAGKIGRPQGTYWGYINKTNAGKYLSEFLKTDYAKQCAINIPVN